MINKYLSTKKPKYLFWCLEVDSNSLMDPFVVETINSWRDYMLNLGDKSKKSILSMLLNNVGVALSNPRNTSTNFHYDSGFVHCSYNAQGDNRKKVMTAVREGGKTAYKSGLLK